MKPQVSVVPPSCSCCLSKAAPFLQVRGLEALDGWAAVPRPFLISLPRRLEGPTHPPLGVDRVQLRPTPSLTLEPGAVLLLFSDGLVERRGEDLDVGLARLADSVRVAPDDVVAIPETLLEANLRDEHRRDDVCLLLVRRSR